MENKDINDPQLTEKTINRETGSKPEITEKEMNDTIETLSDVTITCSQRCSNWLRILSFMAINGMC